MMRIKTETNTFSEPPLSLISHSQDLMNLTPVGGTGTLGKESWF